MTADRIPTAQDIPRDFVLRGQRPPATKCGGVQRIQRLLKKLGMPCGSLKCCEELLAQIKTDGLPADTKQPAVKPLPETDPESGFNLPSRQAIDLFDILVVVAGPLPAPRPVQQQVGAAVEKEIRIKDQIFVRRRKCNRIEELKKKVVPAPVPKAGGMGG